MAGSTGAKRRPRTVVAEEAPAPSTPRQARARNRRLAAAVEGYDITQAMIDGKTLDEIARESKMSREAIMVRALAFKSLSPQAYKDMADSLRTLLANLAVGDVLYWRPIGRNALDTEVQKIANAAYKDAKDTLIKVFGLQSSSVDISTNGRQAPLSMEEIAAHVRGNPEMLAAVDEFNQMVQAKPVS